MRQDDPPASLSQVPEAVQFCLFLVTKFLRSLSYVQFRVERLRARRKDQSLSVMRLGLDPVSSLTTAETPAAFPEGPAGWQGLVAGCTGVQARGQPLA